MTPLEREVKRITFKSDTMEKAFRMHSDEKEALRQAIVFLYRERNLAQQALDNVESKIDEILALGRQNRQSKKIDTALSYGDNK